MARARTVTETLANDPNSPWGTIPPGALRFTCHIDGKRQTWQNDVGVVEHEFPIDDLSLELIRERWGDGAVLLSWQGEKDGKRGTCGTGRRFTLSPLEDEEDEEEQGNAPQVLAPAAPSMGGGNIQEAFALLAGLESMADNRAKTINAMKNAEVKMALDAHQANANTQLEMMRLVMGREDRKDEAAAAAQSGGVLEVLKSIAGAVEALGARMTKLESGEGEDEGGLLDDMTIQPGQSVGEVAAAVAMNAMKENLPGIVTGLASMAQGMGAKMQADAQEKREAKQTVTQPPPVSSAPYTPTAEAPKVTVETRRDNPNPSMPAPEPKTIDVRAEA